MRSGFFKLRWYDPQNNREFITNYWYCPNAPGNEATGKTLAGYKRSCIAFGKRDGFIYRGQVPVQ